VAAELGLEGSTQQITVDVLNSIETMPVENFPNLGPQPVIDVLIGIDYAELHFSIRDVCGQPGKPVA